MRFWSRGRPSEPHKPPLLPAQLSFRIPQPVTGRSGVAEGFLRGPGSSLSLTARPLPQGPVFSDSWPLLLPPQGPDFGYVTRGPPTGPVTDLDSFGNLEVSPPVTVRGKAYPLGRILIGDSGYPR